MTYTSPNLLHNRCNPAMFVAPIDVDGWPTSKAALRAYGPTRLKTVQRDAHGRIAAIVEQIG